MLLISDEFYKQADILCKNISNVEWSGIVIYKITGSILSLFNASEAKVPKESIFIEALDIIPMDKGTVGYTDYKFGPKVQKYMKNLAEERGIDPKTLYSSRLGHVHSHVNMTTGFSSTDMDELDDNVRNHNGYLSIITNNRKEYNAKFVVAASLKSKNEGVFTDIDGQTATYTKEYPEKMSMVVFEPEIIFEDKEIFFNKTFLESMESIKAPKVPKISVSPHNYHQYYNNRYSELDKLFAGTEDKSTELDKLFAGTEDKSTELDEIVRQFDHNNGRSQVLVSGNMNTNNTKNVKEIENVFMNFITIALVEAHYSEEIKYKAELYSLTRILHDLTKSYVTEDDKIIFKTNLEDTIPEAYNSILGTFDTMKDLESYVNTLRETMSFFSTSMYVKNYTEICKLIQSTCNHIINDMKKKMKSTKKLITT